MLIVFAGNMLINLKHFSIKIMYAKQKLVGNAWSAGVNVPLYVRNQHTQSPLRGQPWHTEPRGSAYLRPQWRKP